MKRLSKWFNLWVFVALLAGAAPVYAREVAQPQLLPPVPEWPLIGPVLVWLGVVEPEPEVVEEAPLRDLPEYTIETVADATDLQTEVEAGQSVRLMITEETLNTLIAENNSEVPGLDSVTVDVAEDLLSFEVKIDGDTLVEAGVELPFIDGQELKVDGSIEVTAAGCMPVITLKKLRVNGIGVAFLVRGEIDTIVSDNWPTEVCLEAVTFKSDEIVAEGYRR
ncbi:MAG TPA: hypothetical protein PKH77_23005 [Anaerolineae bacterium]|nr:hypothetical protein [Anaerolineae bacterium]